MTGSPGLRPISQVSDHFGEQLSPPLKTPTAKVGLTSNSAPGRMLSPLKGIRSPAARPKPWPHVGRVFSSVFLPACGRGNTAETPSGQAQAPNSHLDRRKRLSHPCFMAVRGPQAHWDKPEAWPHVAAQRLHSVWRPAGPRTTPWPLNLDQFRYLKAAISKRG